MTSKQERDAAFRRNGMWIVYIETIDILLCEEASTGISIIIEECKSFASEERSIASHATASASEEAIAAKFRFGVFREHSPWG